MTEQQRQRNLSALYICVSGSHRAHEISWVDAKLGLLKEEFMSGMSYLAFLLSSFSKVFFFFFFNREKNIKLESRSKNIRLEKYMIL